MIVSVHQPQYIPWLGYFDKIARSDCFVFLDRVQYKPREFQNRNKIRTKNGWIWLTVPVVSGGRQSIYEAIIDNAFPWKRKHLMSLKSAYSSAAFFADYFPFFEDTYARKWEKLSDLNTHIITYLLEKLNLAKPIDLESGLNITDTRTERIIQICKKLKADTYLSGAGGKDYLEEEKFARAGLKLVYQNFIHPAYRQQFTPNNDEFIPYLSILDLLFNEGVKSREVLSKGE